MGKQTKHFKGYALSLSVIESRSVVSKLKPGKQYKQSVHTSRYYQLYPIDLTITSKLPDDKQLKFNSGQSWAMSIHLDPFNAENDITEVLDCLAPKIRSQETITVDISGGDSANFPLQVDIAD
jgi:hypothetical protein